MDKFKCKICGSTPLAVFEHTAKCGNCGVLLYYPYPESDSSLLANGKGKPWEGLFDWYSRSSFYNHRNFTNMILFAMDETCKDRKLDILDYGGGGGQFALVCKSHFPQCNVYITDICDDSMLKEWSPLNFQIPFKHFDHDNRRFDFIFLNDVFEHLSDPLVVLRLLSGKLKNGGKIVIDTPKQFWIYPFTKLASTSIYKKVIGGTVSTSHLQIWSKKSFELVVKQSCLRIIKYQESSEYTMPADHYMKNMGIKNPIMRLAGWTFYRNAKWLAKNKIICVLLKNDV